uniref:RepA protein n=1 Tax=Lactiplantibacillus paraplantarum TaxID=60520 RepID=T2KH12_9LACO|nr:RepA protein [Lactiplantibacillus paraplantarum]
MCRFVGIILNAKYRVEKDHKDIGVIIPLDDEELKFLMTKALRRYFRTCLESFQEYSQEG